MDFGWGFMHIAPPRAKARTQPAHAGWPHGYIYSRNSARCETGLSATL